MRSVTCVIVQVLKNTVAQNTRNFLLVQAATTFWYFPAKQEHGRLPRNSTHEPGPAITFILKARLLKQGKQNDMAGNSSVIKKPAAGKRKNQDSDACAGSAVMKRPARRA